MDVLLDLWGVLTDSRRMTPAYHAWLADTLAARHGGPSETWRRSVEAAYAWYEGYMGRPETWARGSFMEVVNRADAEHLVRTFRGAGAMPPDDPLAVSRALEFEGMARVDAAFPDARPAVDRLRGEGHRVFVTTNATESNARGALTGARLLDTVDGVFTGESLNAGKGSPEYWGSVEAHLGGAPAVVVDDRLDYLAAAASSGFPLLLMDRLDRHGANALPRHVRAVLRNLAGLPQAVITLGRGGLR